MDTTHQRISLKPDPEDGNEELLTTNIKLEPYIKLEPETDIYEEFPDRILPDSPGEDFIESVCQQEMYFPQNVKINLGFDSHVGPSSSNMKKQIESSPWSNITIDTSPENNSTLKFTRVAKSEHSKNFPITTDSEKGPGPEFHSVLQVDDVDVRNFVECHFCGSKFTRVNSMNRHIRTLHKQEQRYMCEYCGKTFTQQNVVKIHISTIHKGEQPFQCEECGKKFGRRRNLKVHQSAVHMKHKPYECLICGKTFSLKGNMKCHINLVHNKIKIYECSYCGNKFNSRSKLEDHVVSVHKKEKPYECKDCRKKFGRNNDLNRHIKAVHRKEQPYECQYCCNKFTRRHHMKRHVNTVHRK